MNKSAIKAELEAIRRKAGGILKPEDVVKVAKKASSPLHGLFEWDDGKAAEQYRLVQARTIIRSVKISNREDAFKPMAPAYVSLHKDRETGGGYRATEDVVQDDELREALRETALAELRGWIKRYRTIEDLVGPIEELINLKEAAV